MKTAVLKVETSRPGLIGLKKKAFSEILVPTDFSSRSDRAVNYAVELARRLECHLTLLHVVPAPYAIDYTLGGIPDGQWEEVRHRGDKKLEAALQRAKIRYESVDALVRVGSDLHEEIVGAVREVCADLVVLSTHGYKGWKLLLFGSDAEDLLIKIPCPLVVVR
jgi:nucleotide-binding universal stress UspA family protein